MIISHEHKFIYFKSCKTAGTSIEVFLSAYCGDTDIITRIGEPTADWHIARNYGHFRNHYTAKQVRDHISLDIFKGYYKFTSIRNPLDKMLSLYYWWRGSKVHHGEEFNRWIARYRFEDRLPVYHAPFYKIDGKIVTDGFIRYESLEGDLQALCDRLGLEYNSEYLLHYKKRKRDEQDISEHTKDKIRKKFADELIDLNYTI